MIKLIKKYYKFILIYIIIFVLLLIKFPFYIEAPGGIIDINDRIKIDNSYESSGTFNLSYVSEYNATIITLLISLFNSDYKVLSKDEVIPSDIDIKNYQFRDKIMLKEAVSNAIYVGYNKAGKEVLVNNELIYVNTILDIADTNLEVGDQIL